MAVELVDGIDLYNGTGANTGLQAKWVITTAGVSIANSITTGRFSGQAWRAGLSANSSQTATIARTLASATASKSVGFAFRRSNMNDAIHFAWLKSSTTYQIGLLSNADGSLSAGRYTAIGTATTLGSSSSGVILSNTWHYVEIEATANDTTGVFKVYVDGTQVINLTAQDTNNASNTFDTLQLGGFRSTTGSATNLDFDDIYGTDTATKLGEQRVETLYPSSDVAQGFGRSAGTANFSLVNEATTDGDTTYVQGSTVGDVDTYGIGDLSSTPTSISAVQLSAFAEKTDATARSIALQAKSGATTSDGSNFSLASSYAKLERLMTTDPNTSAAWTASGVNALQGGPKVTV